MVDENDNRLITIVIEQDENLTQNHVGFVRVWCTVLVVSVFASFHSVRTSCPPFLRFGQFRRAPKTHLLVAA